MEDKKDEKKSLVVSATPTRIKKVFLNYTRLFKRDINCKMFDIMEGSKKSIKLGIFVEDQGEFFHIVFCFIISDKKTNLESWPVISVLKHNRNSKVTIGEYINIWMKNLLYHIGIQHLYPKKTSNGWINVFSNGAVSNNALIPPAFNSGHYRLAYEKQVG